MIRERIARVLREILNIEEVPFNIPPQPELGDISSAVCLSMAKQRRMPPMKIAQEVAERLKSESLPYIRDVGISSPGYLNFKVNWPALAQDLLPRILQEGKDFGKPVLPLKKKVFIEHTSVNPNKAMHIGHLRNSVLGDTIARVLEWLGYSTEVCNYIDDTGLQVVDVVTALLYLDRPSYAEESGFEGIWAKARADNAFDYFCWDLYARFQNEVENNSFLLGKRDEVLHQIEGGVHPVAHFAKELATRIVRSHLETVYQLSIYYDLLNWESDIIDRGFWQTTFELLKQKMAIRFETEGPNQGCWVVPLGGLVETAEGTKSLDKILVRSNGSVTYTGKDIAYQLWKFGLLKKDFLYKPWGIQANGKMLWTTAKDGQSGQTLPRQFGQSGRVINVIDTRQSYPQQVVVECLRQMGFEKEASESIHLAYEVVNLSLQAARFLGMEDSDEKRTYAMSGRSGAGVKAKDFIEKVRQKVMDKSDHPLEGNVVIDLASAAMRYYLLKFTPESQIVFDFDEALKTTGDTGVYLEYAHARACSILRKADAQKIDFRWKEDCIPGRLTETERKLLDFLSRFSSTVVKSGKSLRLSQLAEYAFDLASSFTDFYEHPDPEADVQTPFIHLKDAGLQAFRLSLVKSFQQVMGNTLDLMGMANLEKI